MKTETQPVTPFARLREPASINITSKRIGGAGTVVNTESKIEVYDADNETIASTTVGDLLRMLNSHATLLAALKELRDEFGSRMETLGPNSRGSDYEACRNASAAIESAEKGAK